MILYLWTLPRWFAAPVVVSAILLGYFVSADLYSPAVILAVLSSLFAMAWSHVTNSYLDYFWTGFDQGGESERSHPKPYTGGQQAIAEGRVSGAAILLSASFWLTLSAALMLYIAVSYWPWVFIPWLVAVLSTFWYSWGKLHYQCEIALGIGFGPVACLLGASVTGSPDVFASLLAGLPVLLIFGFAAEVFDQWWDADTGWDKGLRNIGALVWKHNVSVGVVVLGFLFLTYVVQIALVTYGVLDDMTLITLAAIPGIVPIFEAEKRNKWAVMSLLAALFAYVILLAIGQGV